MSQKSLKDPPRNQTDTLYLQDDYLHYSQMIQNSSFSKCKKRTFLCFSLLLHSIMTINKQTKKNEYIHSLRMLTCIFKILQYGSWLEMTDRQSLDYRIRRKAQNQQKQKMRYTVFSQHFTPFEGLLMNYF